MAKASTRSAGLLVIRDEKQVMVPLPKGLITIGRRQCDIIIDDAKASTKHAEISWNGQYYILKDLNSTNGTFVNRRPVIEKALSDQDLIEIGLTTLCFFDDAGSFRGKAESIAHAEEKTAVTTTKTVAQVPLKILVIEGPLKGKEFTFRKTHITVGRSNADLTIVDLDLSRTHALIEAFTPSAVFVRDMGSTNGTFVNNKKVQIEKIQSGDIVSLGSNKLQIHFDSGAKS